MENNINNSSSNIPNVSSLPDLNNINKSIINKNKIFNFLRNPFFYVSLFLIIILIGLLTLILINGENNKNPSTIIISTSTPVQTSIINTSIVNTTESITTTTVPSNSVATYTPLTDLHLLQISNTDPSPDYYQAGIFTSGKYSGYKRIISINTEFYSGGSGTFADLFATKDDKTYIAQFLYSKKITNDKKEISADGLNANLVVMEDDLLNSLSVSIQLDPNYALFREPNTFTPAIIEIATGKKDSSGYSLTKYIPIPDFSKYKMIGSDNNYTYYQNPFTSSDSTKQKYLQGDTNVFVVDKFGFALSYNLVFAKYVQPYLNSLNKTNQGTNAQYPSLKFQNTDVNGNNNIYSSYDHPFPGGCGNNLSSFIVQNISDSELSKIGDLNNNPIYTLKDKNHPLNKLQYEKISSHKDDLFGPQFTQIPSSSVPSYNQYVSKNPILLLKDNWGRLIVTGEYEYTLGGGCGKPVDYLYPTENTNVSVKFLSPVKFDTAIPSYNNGWNVIAHPNGSLIDLQPKYTNCDSFGNKFGAEYAKQSCLSNNYPYLYWAGSTNNSLPSQLDLGWVISKDNLKQFLDSKLTYVGLNTNEKNDMLSYWIPQMNSKNAAYYKLSFFQTQEMNIIAPMKITPSPNTLFRIFLNWEPLDKLPDIQVEPQALNQLHRNGFTVVEWGGLKR